MAAVFVVDDDEEEEEDVLHDAAVVVVVALDAGVDRPLATVFESNPGVLGAGSDW